MELLIRHEFNQTTVRAEPVEAHESGTDSWIKWAGLLNAVKFQVRSAVQ
jgi:hypothetical protein